MDRFGPMVTARAMLDERLGELRERIVELSRDANAAQDRSLRRPQEYLLSIVRL